MTSRRGGRVCELCPAWIATGVAILLLAALVVVLVGGEQRMEHGEYVVVRNVLGMAFGLSGALCVDRWRAINERRRRKQGEAAA